jgi:hypothetical protein
VTTAVPLLSQHLITRWQDMDPRGDNVLPRLALLVTRWLPPERDAPDADVTRGGWRRSVMVLCSAATVTTVVVLAVAGQLA